MISFVLEEEEEGGSSLIFCAGVSWRVEQRREGRGRGRGREGRERSLVLYSSRGFYVLVLWCVCGRHVLACLLACLPFPVLSVVS